MIVDVHTRVWDSTEQLGSAVAHQIRRNSAEPWDRAEASVAAHDAAMAPVAHAVVLGFESRLLGGQITHEDVAGYVGRDPNRLLGFAGIDPMGGQPVESLDRARALGLVGVVVSPAAQGFHPANTRAMPLYEACEAHGLPVMFESGVMMARQTQMEFGPPYLIDEVARAFPELRLIISGFGEPWIDQGLAMITKHPNVYTDLSHLILRPWQLYNALLMAYNRGVTKQILFGSNFPFCSPEQAIVTIYSVNTFTQGTHLPSVPREQLRSIVERDALTCLGLRSAAAGDKPTAPEPADAAEQEPDADDPEARSIAHAEDKRR